MRNLYIEIWFADKITQNLFGRELLFLSRIYSRFISSINITNLRKISIELVQSPKMVHIIPHHQLTKVCLFYKYFDANVLNNKGSNTLNLLLDIILESMMELSEKFHWEKEKFIDAYNKVIESDFKNEFVLIPERFTKNRRYGASIIIEGKREHVSILLQITEKKHIDEPRKIELIKVVYYKDEFSDIVHKIRWVSDDELIVSNKFEEINYKYSLKNKLPELFLITKIHNEEYLKDELRLLNPETSNEERLLINEKRITQNFK